MILIGFTIRKMRGTFKINDFQPNVDYNNQPPQNPEKKGMSIASLVLGIVGFLAWCIPLFGFPVTIVGLILGICGIKKGGKGMAIAGIVCCAITLILTIINSVLGAYLGATGQLF